MKPYLNALAFTAALFTNAIHAEEAEPPTPAQNGEQAAVQADQAEQAAAEVEQAPTQETQPAAGLSTSELVAGTSAPLPLFPSSPPPIYNDFGSPGYLQMPSARMAPDGEVALTLNKVDPYLRYNLNVQMLPWLDATLRYVQDSSVTLFTGKDNVDKGVDLRFRLLEETEVLPAVALGLRDLAGTGLFNGEFLVASKRLGNFDFTAGLGWGNLGERDRLKNPFCSAAERFCTRPGTTSGKGGQIEFNKFFTGPMSPIAGVSWQTPWQPLILLAEADGNDYSNESNPSAFESDSPFNFGAQLRVNPNVALRVGFERGNTVMFGVAIHGNLNTLRQAKKVDPITPVMPTPEAAALKVPVAKELSASNESGAVASNETDKEASTEQDNEQNTAANPDWVALSKRLQREAGYEVEQIAISDDTLQLRAEQTRYRDALVGHERAMRVLQATVPAPVQRFELIDTVHGLGQVMVAVDRDELVDALTPSDMQPALDDVLSREVPKDLSNATAVNSVETITPEQSPWSTTLTPYLQQGFGGVDSIYTYDIGGRAELAWAKEQTLAQATVLASLLNNYTNFTQLNPGFTTLPPVRTRIREYLDQPIRLETLQLTQFGEFGSDWQAQAYGGYLELMFAGVGGEVLYRPLNSTWGVGVDVNVVRQRDPASELGLLDYQVETGHVTLYKDMPNFYDFSVKLSAGRYLAGDVGGTLDISRKFASGVVVGGYFARTNVSAEEFGEGSFNKGFYLQVPLDLLTIGHTKSKANLGFNPIQRDGGQKLNRRNSLWSSSELRGPRQ